MKTIASRKTFIRFTALSALALGLGSYASAGSDAQFWAQRERERAASAKPAEAAQPAGQSPMTCTRCNTTDVMAFHSGGFDGKVPAFYEPVGTKHSCAACGGAVTRVRGTTANDMKDHCPICAESAPGCCNRGSPVDTAG